jgi:hypothetical protein
MRPALVPLLVLLASALAGCGLDATAEADSVCVSENVAAPITTPGVPVVGATLPIKAQLDLGAAIPDPNKKGVTTVLGAQSMSLTSPEHVDLSGIDALSLTVSAPGKPDVVFTYARSAGAAAPIPAVVATPNVSANLVDYLQDGRTVTVGNLRVSGRLPAATWTPALRTCASTKVTVDYVKAAGL